jgi:hypothetical protein
MQELNRCNLQQTHGAPNANAGFSFRPAAENKKPASNEGSGTQHQPRCNSEQLSCHGEKFLNDWLSIATSILSMTRLDQLDLVAAS